MAARGVYLSWLLLFATAALGQNCPAIEKTLEPSNYTKTLKRAEQGDDSAQLKLGRAYECRHELAEAARWYRKAADRGNEAAQTNLGALYLDGHGVEKDDVEGFKLFLRAATRGFAPAQNNVGIMFGSGRGTRKSD